MTAGTLRVTKESDEGMIKFLIDLNNIIRSEEERIDNTDRRFLEALVLTHRELGTINSAAADEQIRQVMGSDFTKKSIRDYRSKLVNKGWVKKLDSRRYDLIPGLKFKKELPNSATMMLVLEKG